ncbi:MAG: transglycosylase domain-containing protein [Spirochaetales bacterium]|nr:transglycosylase domain-containing protein [Spirochaetales bacterium]
MKIVLGLFTALHTGFLLAAMVFIIPLANDTPRVTSIMKYRHVFSQSRSENREILDLKNIPADLINTIIIIEDVDFFKHQGFDMEAIAFAMKINSQRGYAAYGGSTITQQLARTLFLNPEKNYLRKYLELLLALEIDFFLTKDRILELYLNSAEWGPGVFGIAAGASYHFGKAVHELTSREKIFLVTLMANPIKVTVKDLAERQSLWARTQAVQKALAFVQTLEPRFKSRVRELE